MDAEAIPGTPGEAAWLQRMLAALELRAQLVLSGNVRDLYPIRDDAGSPRLVPITTCLRTALGQAGFAAVLTFDPADGLRFDALQALPELERDLGRAGLRLDADPADLAALTKNIEVIAAHRPHRIACIVDYAAQLCGDPARPDPAIRALFVACDKIARAAGEAPLVPGARPRMPNPVLWVAEQGALPGWFLSGNEMIQSIVVPKPALEQRHAIAGHLAAAFADAGALAPAEREELATRFAVETDGMTLRAIQGVAQHAHAEGMELTHLFDAIRFYRSGTRLNPWKSPVMHRRIANGRRILGARVKGQEHAMRRTLDVLVRSVTGLSGAQASSSLNRPRGVLFFAGPTGVGKTEMAKAVTELLFGDESAYHRFDMSEFSAEHSESRLIGAPPGYEGHAAGGELVNAARARPFSVFLFDEIEKAHPRILDKFLQILDEGRLTDSRGETVSFAESLIVFTSNLGLMGENRAFNMGLNITPSAGYEETETAVLDAISKHFRFELRRPELLNRIGQNVCVFEFVHGRTAVLVFDHMLERVLEAVEREQGVVVRLAAEARTELMLQCTSDLFDGGRGIGNRLETRLINPLAHALFEREGRLPGELVIARVLQQGDGTELVLHERERAGAL